MAFHKTDTEQDASLRKMVRQFGPPGALAILAFGYRAVEIWREEFPKDYDAIRKAAEEEKARLEKEAKAQRAKKGDSKDQTAKQSTKGS